MTVIRVPAGSHYAMLDSIPDRFNGMTTSTMQRSRALVALAGVEVTILTWDQRGDYDAVRQRLRDTGTTIEGVHVRNLWEDARRWDDASLRATGFDQAVPDDHQPLDADAESDGLFRISRHDDGGIHQVDCLRADGSLVASHRHGRPGLAERIVVCDSGGRPIGTWNSLSRMHHHWLDRLPREPVAWLLVDSKVSAALIADYRRPDVAKIHIVRGSHLKRGEGAQRELVTSRRSVMENLDAWDSVTFLTAQQRDDVALRFGPRDNLHVVPNSRNSPKRRPRRSRPAGRGVMLASLEARKRVAHAVRAMATVQRRVPGKRPRLDVWGAGPMESELRDLIRAKRAPVRLRGYSRTAVRAFSRASFSLLTSRSEGLPGVVIESMGRGCIPISYDMPYGPADIITHGVNGFLVPDGDSRALADQIAWIVSAKPAELAPLRAAARARALEFNDEHVVRQWSSLMTEIAARRGF